MNRTALSADGAVLVVATTAGAYPPTQVWNLSAGLDPGASAETRAYDRANGTLLWSRSESADLGDDALLVRPGWVGVPVTAWAGNTDLVWYDSATGVETTETRALDGSGHLLRNTTLEGPAPADLASTATGSQVVQLAFDAAGTAGG